VTNRDELHLLAGAYALDALQPQEKSEFEAYLLTSEEARAEVASLTDTAVMLGMSAPVETPPASLKASLMAQIAVTPQLAAEPAAVTETAPEASVTDIRSLASETRPAPATSKGQATSKAEAKASARWFTRPATYLIAAAAAVAIFFGGSVITANVNQDQQASTSSSFVQLAAAKDVQKSEATVIGGGKATVMWSDDLGRAALVVKKLPALATGKTYQLWYIGDSGSARSAGTFGAANDGSTVEMLTGTMTAGDTIGLTVEPSGGSKKPTTVPIIAIPTA
jgi:anti-sigma-K factor RskA